MEYYTEKILDLNQLISVYQFVNLVTLSVCLCVRCVRNIYVCIYWKTYENTHTHIYVEKIDLVWLVSLFNGISTFVRLFNAKVILIEEQ